MDLDKLRKALSTQDWASAERLLRRAAEQRTAPASVFYNLAQVLVRADKGEEAGPWYRKAVGRDPGHAHAWHEYGAWLTERGELAEAMSAFSRAARLAPQDTDAQRNLGRVALRLGEWEVARGAFLALGPQDDEAALALLRLALETGAPDAQTRAMRRELAQKPALRAHLLKTLTRSARGRVPLDPQAL
ncbi:MAG: tetratricopeptide repeat protein [Neomegalonema sp.]|nr:tetratricopeptide repeat protein [Neomegalonema sp.]